MQLITFIDVTYVITIIMIMIHNLHDTTYIKLYNIYIIFVTCIEAYINDAFALLYFGRIRDESFTK